MRYELTFVSLFDRRRIKRLRPIWASTRKDSPEYPTVAIWIAGIKNLEIILHNYLLIRECRDFQNKTPLIRARYSFTLSPNREPASGTKIAR